MTGPDDVTQPDDIHLLAIKADGSLEFVSVDHDENEAAEGDRLLILQAPGLAKVDADNRLALVPA